MDFKTYLANCAAKIDREVEGIFAKWETYVKLVAPRLLPYNQKFKKMVFGGKKIRGFLILLGYQLVGKKINKEILKVAAAMEIFHTALLVQDDVIDKAQVRRGEKVLYKSFRDDHEGVSQAIVLSDIGIFLFTKTISELSMSGENKIKALALFSAMALSTGLGEQLDIVLPLVKRRSEKEIMTILELKTARYTLVGPLQIGAALAGAKPGLLKALEEFGLPSGVAFQIQDDILGVFGDEKELGKSVTSDVEENKNTLLISYASAHADKNQKEILEKYYGRGPISPSDFQKVKKVFEESGALEYAKLRAEKLAKIAQREIVTLTKDQKLRAILTAMTEFLVIRKK